MGTNGTAAGFDSADFHGISLKYSCEDFLWDDRDRLSGTVCPGPQRREVGVGKNHRKRLQNNPYLFLPYAICNLLDELEPEQWRQPLPDAPDDLMEFSDSPQDSPGFYRMTITFQRHPVQEYSGYFDHYGLPGCWKELIWNVLDLIDFYGDIQIISPYLIQKTRRRKSDLILCSVEFEEGGKPYCYLTDDDQLKPGDRVIVPAGRNQVETAVTVTKIEYAQPEQAPFPLEKIKKVRRKLEIKATEEEQNE